MGALGEEKLARELAEVPGLQALNDRRVRGTRRNIDHIVIAPAGVFVIDAKNDKGMVDIRNRGWLFRPAYRLTVGGRDCSSMADNMAWQVEAVAAVLDGANPMPPITPVLCFLEADWPLFGAPDKFRGVRLEGPRSIKRLVTAEAILEPAQVAELTRRLAAELPPR